MKMLKLVIPVALSVLTACAVKPAHFDGLSVTYEHGRARFGSALEDAKAQCASVGKGVRHDSTECPYICISTFSCVGQNGADSAPQGK